MKHSIGKFNTAAEDSIEKSFFWSLYHNPDNPSMIHFHPGLNSWLSICDKPFACKVVGFFTLQCLFGVFNLCFQLYFISTFRHFFLGNCELEYFDQDLYHEFFVGEDFCIQNFIDFVPCPPRVLTVWIFQKNAFMIVLLWNSNSFSSVTRVRFLTSGSQPETLHL